MPFNKAVESSCRFLGYDLHKDPCHWKTRQGITKADVPCTDEGLRLLAADGSWSEVVLLAERLEKIAAENAGNRVSLNEEGDSIQATAKIAVLAARLPYILVQVTAYFKMQRINEAKKILDTLGDIESDAFLDPDMREKFAPFSLRFLYSIIPLYMSDPMETLRRLYKLLQEQESYISDSLYPTTARRKWKQRIKRIQRTLIYVYYTIGKFDLAIRTFQKMIEWERIVGRLSMDTKCLSEPEKIRSALQLQQFACLCLHCGDTVLYEKAFGLIVTISKRNSSNFFPSSGFGESNEGETDNTSSFEAYLYTHIIDMNEGFKLVVLGKFTEAAERFRSIALRISNNAKERPHQISPNPIGKNPSVMDALAEAVLHQFEANAQTSHSTALLYCVHDSVDAEKFMIEIRDTMEHYLRGNPSFLSQSDAFLSNLVRVYTLCGESKEKLEKLSGVLEAFRCDAASLPNLEKMV